MASVSNLRETEEFINFPSKADHFNKTLEKKKDQGHQRPDGLFTLDFNNGSLAKVEEMKRNDQMPA